MSNSEEIYKKKYEKYVKKYNRQINRVLSKDLSGGKHSFKIVRSSRSRWLKENKLDDYDWYEVSNNYNKRTIDLIQLPTERKTQITEEMFRNNKENFFYTLKPESSLLKPPPTIVRSVADPEAYKETHGKDYVSNDSLEEIKSDFDFEGEEILETKEKKKKIE